MILCVFMGHTVYTQNEIIFEKEDEISRSISGEDAAIIQGMRAGRSLMHKDSEEIMKIDAAIELLKNEKAQKRADYSENEELVNSLKKAAKDKFGLN